MALYSAHAAASSPKSSSSHSSHSRSSSSHRVSSSRAGAYHSSGGGYRGSYSRGYLGSYRRSYGGGYYSPLPGRRLFSPLAATVIIMTLWMFFVLFLMSRDYSEPKSSYAREPLTGTVWSNNCILDETGWFDNIPKTESRLKGFYEKTGVQPYVYLRAYDGSLTTDAEKEAFAREWYEANIDNEDTFLFMYFGEKDLDNDVGLMTVVNGRSVSSVMDAEATAIFWNYIDRYWYSDLSTDDMIVTVFDKTAGTIMTKSTTTADLLRTVLICAAVLAAAVVLYKAVKHYMAKRVEEKTLEKGILETPVEHLQESRDLIEKYGKGE